MALVPLKFARSQLYVNGVLLAKVTSLAHNVNNSTAETTAAEDTISGSDVLSEQQTVTKTSNELTMEFIAMYDDTSNEEDDGQAELFRKAIRGEENVVIERWQQNGKGYQYRGIFTSCSKSSSVGDGIYKYSANYHANDEPTTLSH
jgi:hypothetical protein